MKILIIQKDINSDYLKYLREYDSGYYDLICFGEMATTGIIYEPKPVPLLDNVVKSLDDFSLGVLIGFPYRSGGNLFNGYMYFKDGKYQIYRKINLFAPMNEDMVYVPGEERGVFDTEFGRLGVAICYDLRFEKKSGVEMIFVPAAFPLVRIDDWQRLLVQRAKETGLAVIGINSVGDDGINVFGGNTMIVSSTGKVIARAAEKKEEVLSVEFKGNSLKLL